MYETIISDVSKHQWLVQVADYGCTKLKS